MKERQPITRGIKNCRDSRLFKGCSPLQLLCNSTGNSPAIGNFSYRQRYSAFFMERFDTELKILPTIIRLVVGLVGFGGLLFVSVIVRHLINEPSTLLLVMTIVYSTLTFLFLGLGLFSIKTFRLNNKEIVESYLWGLLKRKTPFGEIENFKSHITGNALGTFEELILNRKTGDTIFIQEFDQKGFGELKDRLTQLLTEDKTIIPNYWTHFNKILVIMLVAWYGLMIGVKIISG